MKQRKEIVTRLLPMTLSTLFVALLFCVGQQNAMAQQVSATREKAQQAAASTDEEEQMDNALRKLGYISGQAYQCQTAPADKTKFEKTALDIANGILRLFGSDRAFSFAAAYGVGSTDKIDQKDCAEAIRRYDTAITKLKVLAIK